MSTGSNPVDINLFLNHTGNNLYLEKKVKKLLFMTTFKWVFETKVILMDVEYMLILKQPIITGEKLS